MNIMLILTELESYGFRNTA